MTTDNTKGKKCGYNHYQKVRYFHGMLMTESDFNVEQKYLEEKRKLLNRMVHGWGVVCGLKITQVEGKGTKIKIGPGLALDCYGKEIFVREACELDIEELMDTGEKWYVVIKYRQELVDPVPVYVPGGECEEKVNEHSRVREGFCIEFCQESELCETCKPKQLEKDEYKDICKTLTENDDIEKLICEDLLMPYPNNCCDEPIVVLGSIILDENNKIDRINNWDCRRMVITFGLLQHWITKLAPIKVPLEAIADYGNFGNACESTNSAANFFKNSICQQIDETLAEKIVEIVKGNEAGISMSDIKLTLSAGRVDLSIKDLTSVLKRMVEDGTIKDGGLYYPKDTP